MKTRSDADAPAKPTAAPQAAARSLGQRVEAGFRDAAITAVREAHESGVPVATLSSTNQVMWLHPGIIASPTEEYPRPPAVVRQRRRAKQVHPQAQQHRHG